MRFLLLAVAFLLLSTNCFAKESPGGLSIGEELICLMLEKEKKNDSTCAEYRHKQDSIGVIRDSLTQYIAKHGSFDKKKRKITFKGFDAQEISRKNELHGEAFFGYVAKQFFSNPSTLIPKKRIEKKDYWIVPCLLSWAEDGAINDGETAFCISKNAIWPCYSEWEKEKSSR